MFVENSLFRTGIFCNARAILEVKDGGAIKANCSVHGLPPPVYTKARVTKVVADAIYVSADGVPFAVCARGIPNGELFIAHALSQLAPGNAAISEIAGMSILPKNTLQWEGVQAIITTLPYAQIKVKMEEAGVPVMPQSSLEDVAWRGAETPLLQDCFTPITGPEDISHVLTIPFDLGCSNKHTVRFAAVQVGAHTKAWKASGWSPRHPLGGVKASTNFTAPPERINLCKEVVILELSEPGSSVVAATTRMLGEMTGAKVITLQLKHDAAASSADGAGSGGADFLQTDSPQFFKHLNKGKAARECKLADVVGIIAEYGANNVIFARDRVLLTSSVPARGTICGSCVLRSPHCINSTSNHAFRVGRSFIQLL
jgi:hypothetical protein